MESSTKFGSVGVSVIKGAGDDEEQKNHKPELNDLILSWTGVVGSGMRVLAEVLSAGGGNLALAET
jgi:hypothetical protein